MTQNEFFLKETKKELAFTCNGVDYYQFTDGGLPIYFNRFRAFQNTVDNHNQFKVTDAVFTEYLDMVDKFTNDNSLTPERRIAEVQRLTQTLKFRRQQSNNLTLVYDISAIWFFDESEDPAEYDINYSQKKIKIWVENNIAILPDGSTMNLLAFFLRTPLNRFINFQDLSQPGTLTYLKSLTEVEFSHSLHNYSMLSETEKGQTIGQNIASLMEIYEGLWKLIDGELQSISTS
jgi:hypothetical protein